MCQNVGGPLTSLVVLLSASLTELKRPSTDLSRFPKASDLVGRSAGGRDGFGGRKFLSSQCAADKKEEQLARRGLCLALGWAEARKSAARIRIPGGQKIWLWGAVGVRRWGSDILSLGEPRPNIMSGILKGGVLSTTKAASQNGASLSFPSLYRGVASQS